MQKEETKVLVPGTTGAVIGCVISAALLLLAGLTAMIAMIRGGAFSDGSPIPVLLAVLVLLFGLGFLMIYCAVAIMRSADRQACRFAKAAAYTILVLLIICIPIDCVTLIVRPSEPAVPVLARILITILLCGVIATWIQALRAVQRG